MREATLAENGWVRVLRFWGPPLVLMALIFFLSSQPDLPSPPDPLLNRIFKKGSHALGYGLLAVSYARALWATTRVRRVAMVALLLTVLYGASDEWHQTYTPTREGRPLDVLIDSVGASVALFLWQRRHVGEEADRAP